MKFARAYLRNLIRIRKPGTVLEPLAVTYYVTHQCNLNCTYCEDFGASRNPANKPHENADLACKVLEMIRQASANLILTGGEPLLHPQIETILAYARRKLKFREITLLTNGLVLRDRPEVLTYVDRLLISLDSIDLDLWHNLVGASRNQAEKILENITWAAECQKTERFQLILNCVLTPKTLPGVNALLEFCANRGILISFSPQSVQNWPDYDLIISPEYRASLDRLLILKNSAAPILGSSVYLKTLASLSPYICHPTLIPRIMPNGALIYPCRPVQRDGGSRGGNAINLLEAGSWQAAFNQAQQRYGQPPETCASCFQQCYAEASLMQEHPIEYLWELLRYAPSRRSNLATFAPG